MGAERFAGIGGVFDHGKLWGRGGKPIMVVGAPYGIAANECELLGVLARFGTIHVSVDDRPSDYGHGTHHVRVEVVDPVLPYAPCPVTLDLEDERSPRLARRAFAAEFTD
jgi:hypothetical protein